VDPRTHWPATTLIRTIMVRPTQKLWMNFDEILRRTRILGQELIRR